MRTKRVMKLLEIQNAKRKNRRVINSTAKRVMKLQEIHHARLSLVGKTNNKPG